MNERTRRQEYAEMTRQALLRTARACFAETGYAQTSVDAVVRRERVTKGALYHHFKNKQELFEAVVDEMLREMVDAITSVVRAPVDPWSRTLLAIDAFLDGCLDPAYQRIVIQEAPVALGWAKWREKEQHSGMAVASMILGELMEQGLIGRHPVDLVAHMLVGAVMEAALVIGHADDPAATRDTAKQVLERIVRSL